MNRRTGPTRVGLAVAVLLASLSLVAWRQGRAMEALGSLDRVQRDITLAVAQGAELNRRIQYLGSRGRVVPEARDRLDMHMPDAAEQVLLDGTRQ